MLNCSIIQLIFSKTGQRPDEILVVCRPELVISNISLPALKGYVEGHKYYSP